MRHIAPQDFSDLVGAIYDCALDPSLWRGTLEDLSRALGFRTSVLALQEMPSGRILLDVNAGISPEDAARNYEYGADVVEQWGGLEKFLALPLATPLVLSWINPRAVESRYAREWGLPLGLTDTTAMAFTRDNNSVSSLGFGRHKDEGPIGTAEVELATLFVPHLKRTLAINRLIDARSIERDTFAAALDALNVAVLLVAPDLRLVHANRAGETMLRTGEPLGVRHGRLTASNGLGAALAVALAVPADGIGRRGLGIPARRADGEELVLHVLPLGEAKPLAGATAAIFVAPAVTSRPPPLAAVAALFDLTPAETRVLDLVGAGRTNTEIAAALGVAVSTVRTHLLRLFEKTGTHRQADLAALLASFSLPIG